MFIKYCVFSKRLLFPRILSILAPLPHRRHWATNHMENGGQSIGVTVHTHESFEDLLQLQRYVGEGWVAGIIGENTLYVHTWFD